MTEGEESSSSTSVGVGDQRSQKIAYFRSPPNGEVDDSSLEKSMNKNKEQLKVKLLLRRPLNQLVAQGIIPRLKTSPIIHEQLSKLEKAKMGDVLKAKIQQRPNREELIRQHILEDVVNIDPSLAQRQRMLKKCQLADALNDQLSHRPGPLELIKKNILHTEEPIERAVKEGQIEFKATSEGQKMKLEPSVYSMSIDDDPTCMDIQSSQGVLSICNTDPPQIIPSNISHQPIFEDSSVCDLITFNANSANSDCDAVVVAMTPVSEIVAPTPNSLDLDSSATISMPVVPCNELSSYIPSSAVIKQQQISPGKDKSKRKSKPKCHQQKSRTIKFHEYKGPPNMTKSPSPPSTNSAISTNSETSYDLLLQQQQLYLQWQLDSKQKIPLKIPDLNATTQPVLSPAMEQSLIPSPSASPPLSLGSVPSPSQMNEIKPLRNLEDMKVSDLKAELKRRNLRVSGAKSHLIQRLKPYTECNPNSRHRPISFFIPLHDDPIPDSNISSPMSQISQMAVVEKTDPCSKPNSPQTCHEVQKISFKESCAINSEDTIKDPQSRIEELQRELLNSQLLLQQQHQLQQNAKKHALQMQKSAMCKGNLTFKPELQGNRSQSVPSVIIPEIQTTILNNEKIKVIEAFDNNHIIVVDFNGQEKIRRRSNTVILGEHPAISQDQLHIIDGQQQRAVSLPNFVGTFTQSPSAVLSRKLEPVLQNESLKLQNYLHENSDELDTENERDFSSDDKVTLHFTEDVDMTSKRDFRQDEEILKLFKQDSTPENVNDVLDLLMRNGEFDPPETRSISQYEETPSNRHSVSQSNELANQVQFQSQTYDSKAIGSTFSDSSIDSSVPSQHLSLEELGIDMESFPVDLNERRQGPEDTRNSEPMDVDCDWLDKLISSGITSPAINVEWSENVTDLIDLFNINDSDFKIGTENNNWDRVDFAA